MRPSLLPQLFGFAIVGAVNTAWAYALFALFVYLGLHYAAATLIAGILSMLTGYLAQRNFVFPPEGGNRLLRFLFVFLIIYGINVGTQKLMLDSGLLTNIYLGGGLATGLCALLSFWLSRNFVFSDAASVMNCHESKKLLFWCLVITGFCLLFIGSLRQIDPDYRAIPHPFWHLIINQDYWGAWLTMGLLITALVARSTAPVLAVVGFFARRPGFTAAVAFAAFSFGTLLIYHDHPLSMDEYAPRFQSEVFASGKLAWHYPVALIDWLIPPLHQNYFLFASHETGAVISAYLPGFALMLTPFTFLGIPWACNPAISALTLLALHKLAQETLSSKEAGGWAVLFALASPVFTISAMSYYSMPAHLLFNLCYTLLLLRPTPGKALLAGLVGGLALILHNPLPHALFALPWIAWLIYRRDFRVVGALLLGYLPLLSIGIGWILFSSVFQANAPAADASLQTWLELVKKVVTLPDVMVLITRLAGTVKLWLWSAPGLLILAFLGFASRSQNTVFRLLLASTVLTYAGYFLIPFAQGHGWGYRYFHSAWGVLPILAAAALVRPVLKEQASTRLVAMVGHLTLASLVLSTGLRLYQVEGFVGQHVKQIPVVDTHEVTVTFVESYSNNYVFNMMDLVQNSPRLNSNRIRMLSQGTQANAQLMQAIDPAARQVAKGSWGETWQISPGAALVTDLRN